MEHSKGGRIIQASEVGLYTYCARAWWLNRVAGYQPVNRAALEAGGEAHRAHGDTVASYHRLQQIAYVLLALALLLGLLLLGAALLK